MILSWSLSVIDFFAFVVGILEEYCGLLLSRDRQGWLRWLLWLGLVTAQQKVCNEVLELAIQLVCLINLSVSWLCLIFLDRFHSNDSHVLELYHVSLVVLLLEHICFGLPLLRDQVDDACLEPREVLYYALLV